MSTRLTVTATTWVTPVVRRVHFRSDDLSAFADSVQTDRYVKIVFPKPGIEYPEPLDIRSLRGTLPPEHMPDVRTYTAIFPDLDAATVAIDFVVHGDEGVAGPWAARAQPGDTLLVNGPGGGYRPGSGRRLAPARRRRVGHARDHRRARGARSPRRPRGSCCWSTGRGTNRCCRCPRTGPSRTSTAATPWATRPKGPSSRAARDGVARGRVHAFVHGEAQETMHGLRPLLLKERGLARDQVSVSGYWRRGRTEDGFRAWKSELAQAEASGADSPAR